MSWRDNPNHWRHWKERYEKDSIADAITKNNGLQLYLMKELEKGGDEDALLRQLAYAEEENARLKKLEQAYDPYEDALRTLEAQRDKLDKEIRELEKKLQRVDGSEKDFERLNQLYEKITAVEDGIVGLAVKKSTGGTRKRRRKRRTRCSRRHGKALLNAI
jgi:septal ring factor EnvC (AmiA/AmiB activator)